MLNLKSILKIIVFSFLLIIFTFNISYGAGSVSSTAGRKNAPVFKYTVRIVAESNGTITDSTSGNPITIEPGLLIQVEFIPDTGGTQPTDLYSIYLRNQYDLDKLKEVGENLSQDRDDSDNIRTPVTTDGGYIYLGDRSYYINATGMGASNAGYVILHVLKKVE